MISTFEFMLSLRVIHQHLRIDDIHIRVYQRLRIDNIHIRVYVKFVSDSPAFTHR